MVDAQRTAREELAGFWRGSVLMTSNLEVRCDIAGVSSR